MHRHADARDKKFRDLGDFTTFWMNHQNVVKSKLSSLEVTFTFYFKSKKKSAVFYFLLE